MSEARKLITNGWDFNVKNLKWSAPKINTKGGKSVKLQDSESRNLVLSSPLMLTWGVNENQWDDNSPKKYDMSLQFSSQDYMSEKERAFFDHMVELENRILEDASSKYCKEWFGKGKQTREVAEALWTPMLKYPKDKETGEPDMTRMPTLRVKLPFWDGKFTSELYNMSQERVNDHPVSFVTKTSHVSCIIQCSGLWFAGGKFGVGWDLVQAVVRPPVRIKGACFVTLDDDDKAIVQRIEKREAEQAEEAGAESVFQDDSVGVAVESSDEEEEVVEATPPPKPKKKVVRKKKVKKDE